jgi:hypothetical protein
MHRTLLGIGALSFTLNVQAGDPQWLKDARAKEAPKISVREIKSTDGWFRARVPANLVGNIELSEGSYSVQLDVGAPSPLSCEVFPDGMDVADGLKRIFANIISDANSQQKVETHALESVDAGNWDDIAWLQATWIYRVSDGRDKLLGGARQYSFDKDGVGVYCGISDLGYSNTTSNVVRALATSLTVAKPAAPAYFTEILVWSARGMNIGVTKTRYERDADGDTQSSVDISMLFPVNGKAISSDGLRREWVRPDGELINAVAVMVEDGNMTANLRLDPRDDRWVISGKRHGKDVEKMLPENSRPGSGIGLSMALRQLVARPSPVGAEHLMWIWDGGDLLGLAESRTRITRSTGLEFIADYQLGKDKSTVTLDRKGAATAMQMSVAGMTLEMRRVYVTGSF